MSSFVTLNDVMIKVSCDQKDAARNGEKKQPYEMEPRDINIQPVPNAAKI